MTFTDLTDNQLLTSIWAALRRMEEALGQTLTRDLPAPQVTVESPQIDLSDIVNAVTGLHPGPSADEIASAIARAMSIPEPQDNTPTLERIASNLARVSDQFQGMPQAFGGIQGSVGLKAGSTVGITSAVLDELRDVMAQRYDVVTPFTQRVTASGDTTLITPPSGERLRITWLYAQSDPDNSGTHEVTFKLGGSNLYNFDVDAGQPWAHGAVIEGAVDEVLEVNLSLAKATYVNADYRTFT